LLRFGAPCLGRGKVEDADASGLDVAVGAEAALGDRSGGEAVDEALGRRGGSAARRGRSRRRCGGGGGVGAGASRSPGEGDTASGQASKVLDEGEADAAWLDGAPGGVMTRRSSRCGQRRGSPWPVGPGVARPRCCSAAVQAGEGGGGAGEQSKGNDGPSFYTRGKLGLRGKPAIFDVRATSRTRGVDSGTHAEGRGQVRAGAWGRGACRGGGGMAWERAR